MSRIIGMLWLVCAISICGTIHAAPPAPPPIEAYGKLPALDMVKLSPSGERYAFIAQVGDSRRLVVATTDNKPLDALTVGDAKVRDIEWAGNDRLLITTTATVELGIGFTVSKNELSGVIVRNVITHKTFSVFNGKGQRVANTVEGQFGTREIDGHWYGFFGGVTYDQTHNGPTVRAGLLYPDLYRVDLETGDLKMAAHGEEDISGWLVGLDGHVVARSLYNQKNGGWWIVKGESGREDIIVSGHDDFRGVGSLHFGQTENTILFVYPNQNDGNFYQELSLTGAPVKQASPNTRPFFDPVSHLWIGLGRDGDSPATFFSPVLQARLTGAIKAFPGYQVHLHSWTPDFNRIIVSTEGKDDSGTYWIVDIAKHSADPLGSLYPEVTASKVGPVRVVNWKAADGLAMQGILTLPPGRDAKQLPLVVLPHGGPEARDYPTFNWWAQAFASRGYAVFQPNFRGSTGYGSIFENAGFGEWGRKMQTDISDGVAALAKDGIIDPKRDCIVGSSYGGYAALAGVTVQRGLYRCAVSVAGVADLVGMLNYAQRRAGSANPATRYWKSYMGVTSMWGSELDPITPSALAKNADAPILLIHGKEDTVVPFDQSETMESALKRAGKPVEFVTMKGEDHWLSREETRTLMLKSAVAFVEKYNPAN